MAGPQPPAPKRSNSSPTWSPTWQTGGTIGRRTGSARLRENTLVLFYSTPAPTLRFPQPSKEKRYAEEVPSSSDWDSGSSWPTGREPFLRAPLLRSRRRIGLYPTLAELGETKISQGRNRRNQLCTHPPQPKRPPKGIVFLLVRPHPGWDKNRFSVISSPSIIPTSSLMMDACLTFANRNEGGANRWDATQQGRSNRKETPANH